MANIILHDFMDMDQKFSLMQENARFDIANSREIPSGDLADVRQRIRAPKALPKTPKIFLSNQCIFNCSYCGCRSGNDCRQAYQASPAELADLSVRVEKERRAGIFLSSAIFRSPDYTAELLNETMRIIRQEHGYTGYLHSKVMPGTDPALIREACRYADRLSVNIEVAKSEGYGKIAVNKNKRNILAPMGHISGMIRAAAAEPRRGQRFASSQTTQMMAGSTGEDDYTILNLSGALYRKYGLSRVYYTAFTFQGEAAGYRELPQTETPMWRVHRLYQADRLMQLYGFTAEDIAPDGARNLRQDLDPKAAWALRNLHLFPIEVNTADYETLLRIPGIGDVYARRILETRRARTITHDVLKRLGVSLKRSRHFLTCNGKFMGIRSFHSAALYDCLADIPREKSGAQLFFDLGQQVTRVSGNHPLHA